MRITFLASVVTLTLNTGTAFVGEVEGTPFAFCAPGLTTTFDPAQLEDPAELPLILTLAFAQAPAVRHHLVQHICYDATEPSDAR